MNKSEIKKILSNLKISNYTIEKLGIGESYIVNVYSGVLIIDRITEFPIKFGYIEQNFGCTHNALTTLKNSPREVGGYFSCGRNSLTDIIGAPNIVGDNFSCYDNRITNLKGLPEKIGGDLICNDNNIRDIYDITNIQGRIHIDSNPVYALVGSFIHREDKNNWIEFFNDCDIIRDYHIIWDRLVFFYDYLDIEIDWINEIKKYYSIIY